MNASESEVAAWHHHLWLMQMVRPWRHTGLGGIYAGFFELRVPRSKKQYFKFLKDILRLKERCAVIFVLGCLPLVPERSFK